MCRGLRAVRKTLACSCILSARALHRIRLLCRSRGMLVIDERVVRERRSHHRGRQGAWVPAMASTGGAKAPSCTVAGGRRELQSARRVRAGWLERIPRLRLLATSPLHLLPLRRSFKRAPRPPSNKRKTAPRILCDELLIAKAVVVINVMIKRPFFPCGISFLLPPKPLPLERRRGRTSASSVALR